MKPTPILFLSDSPDLSTGLARIGRDLATLVAALPQFRVGYLGRGGHGSRQLPFVQYNFPEIHQWGETHIERAWRDFAGSDIGVVFTINDASRMHWLANPTGIDGPLGDFLRSGSFHRWGYFPVDSYGVGGKLTAMSADTIRHYNRVLAYGSFGADVIHKTTGATPEWIPHGISMETFTPRDRAAARMSMGFRQDDLILGCVMTNQSRKDWGLAFSIATELSRKFPNLKFWAHTDVLSRAWDLRALANDFGISSRVLITETGQFNDHELSYAYSACDITMLPSLGEGFGYPVVESMACGVPVVTGNYGGAVELVPAVEWLVDSIGERLDTPHNCVRPVYDPLKWVACIEEVLKRREEFPPEMCRSAVEHLDWKFLWPATWKKWFLEGLGPGAPQ